MVLAALLCARCSFRPLSRTVTLQTPAYSWRVCTHSQSLIKIQLANLNEGVVENPPSQVRYHLLRPVSYMWLLYWQVTETYSK